MDVDPGDGAYVVPHQLCSLCRVVAATFTQDEFWHASSYTRRDSMYSHLDADAIGPLASPIKHHASLANLNRSANQGCHLCALFRASVFSHEGEINTQSQLYVSAPKRYVVMCLQLSISIFTITSGPDKVTQTLSEVELHRHPRNAGPEYCWTQANDILESSLANRYRWSTRTDSEASHAMIRSWLDQCVAHHDLCGQSLQTTSPPKRLLDLGSDLSEEFIRLISSDSADTIKYATLSYCWGTAPSTVLRADNLAAFTSRIQLHSLPQTIRDAIKVCRILRMRYLWVDALCIVQGNNDEFAQEISRMGSIYAGSLFTIAAADSSNCNSGCFRARSPLDREKCVVSSDSDLAFFSPAWHPESRHDLNVGYSLLSNRAWVYQERIMSPRTIHFGKDEIIWECRQRTMCHNCQAQVPKHPARFRYDSKQAFLGMQVDGPPSMKAAYFKLLWSTLVSTYSACVLSNVDDRLSALAGVAQLGYQQLRYQASYGLWIDDIVEELLWSVVSRKRPSVRDSDSLSAVPSWSWASNMCTIGYRHPSPSYAEVEHRAIYCTSVARYPPVTPFGSLSALLKRTLQPPAMCLEGWLRPCHALLFPDMQVPERSPNWTLMPTTMMTGSRTIALVESVWETFYKHANDLKNSNFDEAQSDEMKRIGLSRRLYYSPDDEPVKSQELYCLHLKRVLSLERLVSGVCPMVTDSGIVLIPLDTTKARFRRVGYFHDSARSTLSFQHHSDPDPTSMWSEETGEQRQGNNVQPERKAPTFDRLEHLGYHRNGKHISKYASALYSATNDCISRLQASTIPTEKRNRYETESVGGKRTDPGIEEGGKLDARIRDSQAREEEIESLIEDLFLFSGRRHDTVTVEIV